MGTYCTKSKKPNKPKLLKYEKETNKLLRLLIDLLQKNTDQVEQNILKIQDNLKQDANNYIWKKSFEHQDKNANIHLLYYSIEVEHKKYRMLYGIHYLP
ncbi:hypothetical protein GDO81_018310 [Engystomops pustulosus]|uniref:Periplakin/Envoplakin N-terminal domain-containing protein n=1 Tax=Engystomops pustulosus TaxID=76066 RepID=A0AAV7A6R1_ENGPU|nr:hypothetical protein GDO81_018310 [Engystomops pustulosus]